MFGLNLFFLVVENGYLNIVWELLLRFKLILIISLNKVFYLFVKSGYLDIVDLFLYYGVEDLCFFCNFL